MKQIRDFIATVDSNECKNELVAVLSQTITAISIGNKQQIKEVIPKLIMDLSIYEQILDKTTDETVTNEEIKAEKVSEDSEPDTNIIDDTATIKEIINEQADTDSNILSISEILSYNIVVYNSNTSIGHDKFDKISRIMIPSNDGYTYWLKVYASEEDKKLYADKYEFEKEYPYIKAAYIREYTEENSDYEEKQRINDMFDNLVDLSLLETPTKDARYINNHIEFSSKPKSDEQKRLEGRRQSYLDNYNIAFIFGEDDVIYHDKSCEDIKLINLDKLRGSENAPAGKVKCPKCHLKMLIRKGCKDDFKNVKMYEYFFNKGNIDTTLLEEFFTYGNTKFRIESINKLSIVCKEDSWKIETDGRGNFIKLWHNSYTVDKKGVRHFDGSYHEQESEMLMDVRMAFQYIMDYSYRRNHK